MSPLSTANLFNVQKGMKTGTIKHNGIKINVIVCISLKGTNRKLSTTQDKNYNIFLSSTHCAFWEDY